MKLKICTWTPIGWGFGFAFGSGIVHGDLTIVTVMIWKKCYNLVVLK